MEQAIPAQRTMQISFQFLLSIYIVLPVFFVMYLVAEFLLPPSIKMPSGSYFLLGLLFGAPHIVASNILLLTNKEYLSFYKWRLIAAAVFVAIVFIFGTRFFSPIQLMAMNGLITVIHTAKQQLGIGNMVGRLSGWIFQTWFWSAILGCVILNHEITIGRLFSQAHIRDFILIALSSVVMCCAFALHGRLKLPIARNFFWANTGLALISIFFYSQGYYLFAMFSSRIIHDITAFTFYVVHDHNRHGDSPKNLIYQVLQKTGIGAVFAVPAMAIVVAFVMSKSVDKWISVASHALFNVPAPWQMLGFGFITYIGLIHYYTESFTWKASSPYRKHIAFAPLK